MYKVEVVKQCGCVTKSGMQTEYSFLNKEDAIKQASQIVQKMNDTFCGKHKFEVIEMANIFKIVEAQ
jgi:hypothetical protein